MKNNSVNGSWMLYGATGYTGTLIAEEAVRRGHRPILAGRSAEKLRSLGERLGLEWVAFSLEDESALLRAAESVDLMLHAAGPFAETCEPMMDACLAGKTHYLDIANEIPVLQAAQARDRQAHDRGVSIISGVGFGTVASSSLVCRVCEQVQNPVALEIAIDPHVAQSSAGAAKSLLEVIAHGGYVRRDGCLVRVPFGSGAKRIRFAAGQCNVMPVPAGDLEAAYMAFGIPDIAVYMPTPITPFLARLILPIAQKTLSWDWLRHQIGSVMERRGVTHQQPGASQRSQGWARVTDRNGNAVEAWLETGEGYAFTAAASVLAVEWVLSRQPSGVLTAAAFGSDFALQIEGVHWHDALMEG